MNTTHEGTFVGLARSAVDRIVGHAAATLLLAIDHQSLAYGEHWRWIGGEQLFTEAGLAVIVRELTERGFPGAAQALAIETRRHIEEATVARRWDLRGAFD